MPSVLDAPFDATYAAIGMNLLVLDEISEYFADSRKHLEEQLEAARTQGKKAQEQLQKQTEELTAKIGEALPFSLGDFEIPSEWTSFDPKGWFAKLELDEWTEPAKAQEKVASLVNQSFEMIESAWAKMAESAPAPLDEYLAESVKFARGMYDDTVSAATAGMEKVESMLKSETPAPAKAKKAPSKPRARKTTPKPAVEAVEVEPASA